MSSILKALKKAEQDGSLYKNNPDMKMNVQRIFAAQSWKIEPKNRLKISKKWLLSVVLVIASLGFFFMIPKDQNFDQVTVANPDIKNIVPPPEGAIKKTQSSIPETPASAPSSQTVFSGSPEKLPPAEPELETIIVQDRFSESARMKTPDFHEPEPSKNYLQNSQIEDITGDALKIQAISWDKNPVNRIAVVNNNIVGENEFILEYQIETIGKDDIILKKSGNRFRLKFKYR